MLLFPVLVDIGLAQNYESLWIFFLFPFWLAKQIAVELYIESWKQYRQFFRDVTSVSFTNQFSYPVILL